MKTATTLEGKKIGSGITKAGKRWATIIALDKIGRELYTSGKAKTYEESRIMAARILGLNV